MQIMEWGLTSQTVTMVTGPMYHIGALENYALPTLAVGGRVVVLRSRNFSIRQTLEIASKQQVTDILLFPSMIYQMLQDPEIDKLFPRQRAARLRIELRDGTVLQRLQPHRVGDPDLPLSDRQLNAKFNELATPVIGEAGAHRLLGKLWALERESDLAFTRTLQG